MKIKIFDKFLFLILSVLCVFSCARLLNNSFYWITDKLSHFPFQYAIAAFVVMVICLRRKKFLLAVLSGFLLFFNLGALIDTGKPVQAAGHAESTFLVYSANLHISNKDVSSLNSELRDMDPDIVLLLEMTPIHRAQIESVVQTYPYRIEKELSEELELGFIFLSKFPILDKNITRLSDVCNFLLAVRLEVDKKPVMFYGLHAQRPGIENHNERREQFLRLARQIKKQTLPVILAGDFNATPFSPEFRQLIRISGLRDSRTGFGWQPSWPSYFPPLWIPIDHVLVSPGIHVLNRATGFYIGSDHYPVFAELSIKN